MMAPEPGADTDQRSDEEKIQKNPKDPQQRDSAPSCAPIYSVGYLPDAWKAAIEVHGAEIDKFNCDEEGWTGDE